MKFGIEGNIFIKFGTEGLIKWLKENIVGKELSDCLAVLDNTFGSNICMQLGILQKQ